MERAFRKGPVQSNKEVNQVAWHMLTRHFAVCHRAWMELKAKLWTYRGNRHCSDAAQEAFSDSCNTDCIVWRPIKGENDESSHAGHTQCTNGSGQLVEERGGAPGILKTHFGKQTYGKVSHSRTVCHKETRSQLDHTVFDSSDKSLLNGRRITKRAFTPESGGLISREICWIEAVLFLQSYTTRPNIFSLC